MKFLGKFNTEYLKFKRRSNKLYNIKLTVHF